MVSIGAEVYEDEGRAGNGTSEFAWRQSFHLMRLTELTIDDSDLAVVLAAHPGDETIALGGTIATLLARGTTVIVVTATDGVQARPGVAGSTLEELKARRQNETRAAINALGAGLVGNILNVQLHLPHGNLAGVQTELVEHMCRFLEPNDLCFATWEGDGDPDREAAGRAARVASERVGVRLLQYPVGLWHWASVDDPNLPWRTAQRVSLDVSDQERKDRAVGYYESQIAVNYEDPDADVALPSNELAHFQRSYEVLFT
jgi:LmbE family N-acetylglucosaminyl deacetylase